MTNDTRPLLLEGTPELAQFRAWERGFDAHLAGHPPEHNTENGKTRRLWKSGWNASQQLIQLQAEHAGGL